MDSQTFVRLAFPMLFKEDASDERKKLGQELLEKLDVFVNDSVSDLVNLVQSDYFNDLDLTPTIKLKLQNILHDDTQLAKYTQSRTTDTSNPDSTTNPTSTSKQLHEAEERPKSPPPKRPRIECKTTNEERADVDKGSVEEGEITETRNASAIARSVESLNDEVQVPSTRQQVRSPQTQQSQPTAQTLQPRETSPDMRPSPTPDHLTTNTQTITYKNLPWVLSYSPQPNQVLVTLPQSWLSIRSIPEENRMLFRCKEKQWQVQIRVYITHLNMLAYIHTSMFFCSIVGTTPPKTRQEFLAIVEKKIKKYLIRHLKKTAGCVGGERKCRLCDVLKCQCAQWFGEWRSGNSNVSQVVIR